MNLFQVFSDEGLSYREFLTGYASEQHLPRWSAAYEQIVLTADQTTLLSSFTRQINVLCMAGAWCGDCIEQCPILARCSEATDRIRVRMIDRDANQTLSESLQLCGAPRVPQAVFLSEDGNFISRFGDRTLAKYRSMGESLGGAACALGSVSGSDPVLAQVIQQWIDEIERVHWILRLSPRLREKHND